MIDDRALPERMMTVAEVATLAQVCRQRVYQVIHEGELRASRVGPRSIRIPLTAYQSWVESRMVEAA